MDTTPSAPPAEASSPSPAEFLQHLLAQRPVDLRQTPPQGYGAGLDDFVALVTHLVDTTTHNATGVAYGIARISFEARTATQDAQRHAKEQTERIGAMGESLETFIRGIVGVQGQTEALRADSQNITLLSTRGAREAHEANAVFEQLAQTTSQNQTEIQALGKGFAQVTAVTQVITHKSEI